MDNGGCAVAAASLACLPDVGRGQIQSEGCSGRARERGLEGGFWLQAVD